MKIKRLFWKIFASFWLVSLSIMLATSYAILASVETEKFRSQHEKILRNLAERTIEHYENLPPDSQIKKSLLRRYGPPYNMVNHRHIVSVRRGDTIIYERDTDNSRKSETYTFDVISAKGNRYTVEALTPRPPPQLMNILQRVNTLQFFIILFASTLVSLLLSWSITRPLKQLGVASRQFAQGDLHTEIDPKLLERADELGDLAQDFSYMMRKIQQTISAQKQLLHDVSHELRAPLARLQVAAELIQQKEEKPSSYIQRIHAECERMDELIQRILNFARLEESTATFATFDLVKLLRSHIDNIQFEYPQREIRLSHDMTTLSISADKNLLGEAIDNILRNACKYTPENAPIDLAIKQSHQHVICTIRDYGSGVSPEDLAKLTTPFYRSDNRMHGDGFGLGLSIARRAMEKHGGTLTLGNHPEGGLQVVMTIPERLS